MKEIICPNCGKSNPADAEFCSSCFTVLKDRTAGNTEPTQEESPEWLKKIRERSQAELPPTPPLGEFGEAESRPFNEGESTEDVPDWLKEIQKNAPQKPVESEQPERDWMSRLHEILPQSDQSTTFFTEEELAARAAAERRSFSEEMIPTGHASTQPVDVPAEPQSDFPIFPSGEFNNSKAENEFIESLNGYGVSEEPGDVVPESSQPESVHEEVDASYSPSTPESPVSEPEGSIIENQPVESNETFPVPDEEEISQSLPMEESQPSMEGPDTVVPVISDPSSGLDEVAVIPQSAENPVVKDRKKPFSSLFGKKDDGIPTGEEGDSSPEPEKEQLIPDSILQPQYDRSVEYSGRLEISDQQRASVSLLKNMLTGELQPVSPEPAVGKFSRKMIRLIIGFVLLAGMLVPLITGHTFFGTQALFSPGVVAMHSAISAIPENTPFLVITDYEPAFSGELRESAVGVIGHMMKKGLNFSILSTIPSGPALAHDLVDYVQLDTLAYQPEKLAYFGYLPGGTTGLRDFIRNPREAMPLLEDGKYAWTYPATQSVFSISDYSGVLIITENTETGRAWIEQLQGSMAGKPVLLVVSAQSAPLMRPYLDSKQLNGLIGGQVEGAMYDRIIESPPRSTSSMAAYQAGMVIAAALMLFGGFYGILLGVFSRGGTPPTEDFHVR